MSDVQGPDWDDRTADDGANDAFVRPFMITGGRTVGDAGNLPIETMVRANADAQIIPTRSNAHLGVLQLCQEAQSIAEIAAMQSVPIGVVRVLVADLTASGHVESFATAVTDDVSVVRRLLDGIRAL